MRIENRYTNGDYAFHNPTWDTADSHWKFSHIKTILNNYNFTFLNAADVGCGAGLLTYLLANEYPNCVFDGYDVSPHLQSFWPEYSSRDNLAFHLTDFLSLGSKYDLIFLVDVLEHLRDPLTFLEDIAPRTKYILFHLPLDLSASSVLRSSPLLKIRESVGHLHSFTRDLALQTLTDSGLSILHTSYSKAWFRTSNLSLRRLLAFLPRLALTSIDHDFSARLLGGESLFVLTSTAQLYPC